MTQTLDKKEIRAVIGKRLRECYVPVSTYRVQMNSKFNFKEAVKAARYLADLGVDAVYSSPLFQAMPGSMHGYDVTNPTRVNPEIGSEKEWNNYIEHLKKFGLKQILDVVPNHMGIVGSYNDWWQDVLENGPHSIYARFFDIDWTPEKKELEHKVLLPVLGDQFGNILERREFELRYHDGKFTVAYWDQFFPVAPETYPIILEYRLETLKKELGEDHPEFKEFSELIILSRDLLKPYQQTLQLFNRRDQNKKNIRQRLTALTSQSKKINGYIKDQVKIFNGEKEKPASFNLIEGLLSRQYYRLSSWRVASHEINYRRFFNINQLAALRMEDPIVFQIYHEFLFRLIVENKVQGLRIDHPDGLCSPTEYFRRLQREYLICSSLEDIKKNNPKGENSLVSKSDIEAVVDEMISEENIFSRPPLYVVAEKILDRKEPLPFEWPISGTVGYGFLNALNGLFVDPENEAAFNELYKKFIGYEIDFEELVYEKKKLFAAFYMSSEINNLGHRLDWLSERNRHFRDFTLNDLTTAIREVIACFPVYRTYINPETGQVSEQDEKYINIAIEKARGKHPALSKTLFDFIQDVLFLKADVIEGPEDFKHYSEFIQRFQQLSGPIMAKGLEDTAFYIYNRLISLNEVGGDPVHFGFSKADFHKVLAEKNKKWPNGMVSTSTHDTKRGEDARMRLNVLSEIPKEWNSGISKWSRLNEPHRSIAGKMKTPDRNTEYFIYQTLIAAWPEDSIKKEGARSAFVERIWGVIQKSIREAKVDTSWLNPKEDYEQAVKSFLEAILSVEKSEKFLSVFRLFQKRISEFGKWNSMSALILKLGAPGVTDTYQGNELWDFSLVDPDNRRLIDYRLRIKGLAKLRRMCEGKPAAAETVRELLQKKKDGLVKMYLLWKGLQCRKKMPGLFLEADYHPLEVEGDRASHVMAFLRKDNGRFLVTASARFFAKLYGFEGDVPFDGDIFSQTKIMLPAELKGRQFTDIFTGEKFMPETDASGAFFSVSSLFRYLKGAILLND